MLTPRVPLPARGVAWSASDPPRRQRSLLDLGIEPLDLLPVKRACRPNRLSNAIGQEHAGAVVKGFFESGACRLPAIRHLPKFRDATTAIGRQGEEVGHDHPLEAEDDPGLLDASQGALTARLGRRVGAHHQQGLASQHGPRLRELRPAPSYNCVSTLRNTQSRKADPKGTVMTQHHPKDSLQADLEALAKVFEAEDREDRRRDAQRRREGLPEPKRDIRAFPGFADGGAAPRN